MRILVVADIHGNWPALRTLDEPHDTCFCLGDLVDYALEPAPCIDWVRKHAHYAVRGNHDHAVAQNVLISGRTGFKYLAGVTRVLTRQRIGAEDLRFLADLPVTQAVTMNGTRFLLVHATPRDPLDEYAQPDPDFWSRQLRSVDVDVVCVGHTHQPYVLEADGKLVINAGSVGQPRDGDPRAAYVVIEDNRVEIKRVAYPVEETIRTVQESTLPDQAKTMLSEVFRTGRGIFRMEDNNQDNDKVTGQPGDKVTR